MTDDSLLAQLAEEFTAEVRDGKPGDIEEYARRYPKLADRIRELFPTLMLLEGMAAKGVSAQAQPANQPGLSPNSIFGQYRIKGEIGRGGMGIVYEAVHMQLEKRVALKILPVRTSMDAGQLERFFREARTAAGLHHTNIVPVFDVGQIAGTPYYAMEHIEGRSLAAILHIMQSTIPDNTSDVSPPDSERETASEVQVSSERGLEPDDRQKRPVRSFMDSSARVRAGLPARLDEYFRWVANMGIQAAEGLAHAHERKVMHRDIKPSNLLLDSRGVLWITDFGLARRIEDPAVTQSGIVLGTPRYMSPEQAEAAKHPVDQRSDIYSLGATLYELLTCRPVFEGKTPHDVISQILTREPVAPRRLNPEIPTDLSTIVMKAMAKRPEDRYQLAAQLADDLSRWLSMEPIKARRIGPLGRTIRWCRRNPRLAIVTAIAVTIILFLSCVFYVGLMREYASTQNAFKEKNEALLKTEDALKREEESRRKAEAAEQNARNSADQAQKSQKLAESERNAAEVQKRVADFQRKETLYNSYRGNLLSADLSYSQGQVDAAKEHLALCDPGLRGWEWHYLDRLVERSLAAHVLDTSSPHYNADRDVREIAFGEGGDAVFVKAHRTSAVIRDGVRYGLPELAIFKYLPDTSGSFEKAASSTNVVAISPNGSYALSSEWSLEDVNIKCVPEGSDILFHFVCRPVSYNSVAAKFAPETFERTKQDRLIVMDTRSGRVTATLHHPNLAVWSGASEALLPLKGKEITGAQFASVVSPPLRLNGNYFAAVGGAFSRDGSRLATWSWDNIIYVWDLKTESLLASLQGHQSAVRAVSFSPDRTQLASSSSDGTVRLWRIESRKEIKEFQVPMGAGALAYSRDGTRIAAGTDSGLVLVLDVFGENAPTKLSGHSGMVSSVAFSRDSKLLVAASHLDRVIRLWDVDSGTLRDVFIGDSKGISSVAFSPDGTRIASGSMDGTLRIWALRSPNVILKGINSPIVAVGFSTNDENILACSMDCRMLVWDILHKNTVKVLDFDPEHRFSSTHSWLPGSFAIGHDKAGLAYISSVFEIESGNPVFTYNRIVEHVGLTPDGKRLATASRGVADASITLSDTETGRLIAKWEISGKMPSSSPIALNADGSLIAAAVDQTSPGEQGHMNSSILVFSTDSPDGPLSSISSPDIVGCWQPTFFPDGKRIAFASGDKVHIWDLGVSKEVGTLAGHDNQVSAIAVSPDGSRIVTGGNDGTVRIWDAARYELLLTLRVPSIVMALAVSSDSETIVAGMSDGKVHIWYSAFPGE